MNHQMISMLEDIKTGTYTSYTNYLDEVTVNQILHWFTQFALGDTNETIMYNKLRKLKKA